MTGKSWNDIEKFPRTDRKQVRSWDHRAARPTRCERRKWLSARSADTSHDHSKTMMTIDDDHVVGLVSPGDYTARWPVHQPWHIMTAIESTGYTRLRSHLLGVWEDTPWRHVSPGRANNVNKSSVYCYSVAGRSGYTPLLLITHTLASILASSVRLYWHRANNSVVTTFLPSILGSLRASSHLRQSVVGSCVAVVTTASVLLWISNERTVYLLTIIS